MSTVKIKTEPTTATAAAVAVQVKLEPSLSTAGIKLEQHTSDIDTKVESGSEADIKSENADDDDDDEDSDQTTATSKNQRHFICEYPGCDRRFGYASLRKMHQHEHRLQTELYIYGKTYTLSRQSLDSRWPCPIPDCSSTYKTASGVRGHVRKTHNSRVNRQQQQQLQTKMTRYNLYFLDVNDFYVGGIRCGFHTSTAIFICHECRVVPECLLAHLQQTHGYDGKSIDNSALPESAVNANADPSVNQHTNNPHLAASISQPYQHHQYIVQGWQCITSDCGYCGFTVNNKTDHKKFFHQGEQMATVPALVLRLSSSKVHTSYFFITRIDQATASTKRVNRHKLDCNHNELSSQDENEITDESNKKRQWKCEYPNCERFFNSADQLSSHRHEHKLEAVVNVNGNPFTLTRQSLDDRWPCPVPDCETTWKAVSCIRPHMRRVHSTLINQKRVNSEDDNDLHHESVKRIKHTIHYLNVDDFYVCGARFGFHTTTGVFICYECKLVPECLLTHLQLSHGYDEKSINNSVLPESAVTAGTDPNGNQHTNNSHLAPMIHEPTKLHHPDIFQGWLCVASNCGYCYSTVKSRNRHQRMDHKGEQLSTVPALVLRLLYSTNLTSYFLITRLDTPSNSIVQLSNSASQCKSECDYDDGDELVLSEYSD